MAKTEFANGSEFPPAFANEIFFNATATGSRHDGSDADGHLPKINLAADAGAVKQEVTGLLPVANVATGLSSLRNFASAAVPSLAFSGFSTSPVSVYAFLQKTAYGDAANGVVVDLSMTGFTAAVNGAVVSAAAIDAAYRPDSDQYIPISMVAGSTPWAGCVKVSTAGFVSILQLKYNLGLTYYADLEYGTVVIPDLFVRYVKSIGA
jgi:hypothetical protein